MNRPSPARKPPSAPGTGHRDGCACALCKRWRDATLEAARLKAFHLQKAVLASKGAAEGRKEAKRDSVREGLDRDVQHTERKAAEYARAAAAPDPRMEVFLALRAQGLSFADASAEVERQFDSEPINQGDDDA